MKKYWFLLILILLTGCGSEQEKNMDAAVQNSVTSEADPTLKPASMPGPTSEPASTPQPTSEPASTPQPTSESASTPQPTPEPVVTPVPEISLIMVGDILLHTPLAESGKAEDGSYDFSAVFSNLQEEISQANLSLVNQEVIIGGVELGVSGYPTFNAPYELGDALVEAGFDVVLHATNHALDKRARGLLNCLDYWEQNHPQIEVLGIHDSAEDAQKICIYEQEGIRLAILNYTYGTNGIPLPEDMPYAVDMLDKEKIAKELQYAEEAADFVVVCPHWGSEYVLEPTEVQKNWARFFAENGADLILGTHPHVIEPVEWIAVDGNEMSVEESHEGDAKRDGATDESSCRNQAALVYYSLGNFVNWTSGKGAGVANRMVGAMAEVTIGRTESGEVEITSYGVKPLVCHVEQGFGGVTVYSLEEYTEELAGRNEIVKQDENFSLQYCNDLVEKVFGELWSE